MAVLGVDACRDGWIGVLLGDDGTVSTVASDTIADLLAAVDATPTVVAVDIPIGLSDCSFRVADLRARERLGARRTSVFMTPARAALEAPTHADAVRISRALTGTGVSVQAFGLRHRIFEVERWSAECDAHVVEAHPEVCFAEMAGGPTPAAKKTWAGAEQRRALLRAAGIELDGELGYAGRRAAVDDVLDAAAAAWTARRVANGSAYSLPDPPEQLVDGSRAAIWV